MEVGGGGCGHADAGAGLVEPEHLRFGGVGQEWRDLEFAEAGGERLVLREAEDPLLAKAQHLVFGKRGADRGDGGGVERLRQVDAGDVGAERAGEAFEVHDVSSARRHGRAGAR